ncbi:MAG: hypothetical protein FJX72_13595, partial [Armatimonadetes bacterium]|nr:hypothetical protein [Armatimonadota bacterium]
MPRISLAILGAALGLALSSSAFAQAVSTGGPCVAVQGPTRPFTDTMLAMIKRDEQWRREIEAGLRPAPPPMRAAGNHVRGQMPDHDGDGPFAIFLPAAFADAETHAGKGRDHRVLAPQNIGASFVGISLQDHAP